jgi:hypothetical protein
MTPAAKLTQALRKAAAETGDATYAQRLNERADRLASGRDTVYIPRRGEAYPSPQA